jgi:predicted kinase
MLYTPELILTVGIPGCGKSTWVKENKGGAFVICPDEIRRKLTGKVTDQSKNDIVWIRAKDLVIENINTGYDVILDATNVNTTRRHEFLHGLPECRLFAKCFPIAPEEAYARIKRDLDAGIDRSAVPEELVYKMYGEFLYTMKVLKDEGFTLL